MINLNKMRDKKSNDINKQKVSVIVCQYTINQVILEKIELQLKKIKKLELHTIKLQTQCPCHYHSQFHSFIRSFIYLFDYPHFVCLYHCFFYHAFY